jgi:thiol-disulfide isomerase/thioredoxin
MRLGWGKVTRLNGVGGGSMRSIVSFALFAATAGVGERLPVPDRRQPVFFGAISLYSLDAQSVLLSSYAAPVTVLVLWATWCKPCLEELPYVEQLHQLYKDDRDVAILAISIDRPGALEKVRAEAERLGLSMPVLIDAEASLRKALSIPEVVPALLFVYPDFEIVRETGFNLFLASQFVAEKRETIERARARIGPKVSPTKKRVKRGDAKPGAKMGSH